MKYINSQSDTQTLIEVFEVENMLHMQNRESGSYVSISILHRLQFISYRSSPTRARQYSLIIWHFCQREVDQSIIWSRDYNFV